MMNISINKNTILRKRTEVKKSVDIELLKQEYETLDIDHKKIQNALVTLLLYLDLYPSRFALALEVSSRNLNYKEIVFFNKKIENLDPMDYEYTEAEINERLKRIVN